MASARSRFSRLFSSSSAFSRWASDTDIAHLDQRQSQRIAKALLSVRGWYSAGRQRTIKYGRQRVYRKNGVP